jgi:hypothetical protein
MASLPAAVGRGARDRGQAPVVVAGNCGLRIEDCGFQTPVSPRSEFTPRWVRITGESVSESAILNPKSAIQVGCSLRLPLR